jgi:uncharacterized protein YyaL (SSP411 family)
MAHESFEDEEIAALLNDNFVSVKIDREERPDIDEIYMEAVRIMTGSGGWPLTVFLTPDLKPFYGGTYFPPEPKHGLLSFRRVLESVTAIYGTERDRINQAGSALVAQIDRLSALPAHEGELTSDPLHRYYEQRLEVFDSECGGFGVAPRFPNPTDLLLLTRLADQAGFNQARHMVEFTLHKLADGGIYDHLGGGFHRYSTDSTWLIPHFEKMLYDNALLARVYTEAYVTFKEDAYRAVAEDILAYMERELRTPNGGFYATQDADTDGDEGAYYVWSKADLDRVLDSKSAALAADYYGVTLAGNFEGRNVLHVAQPVEKLLQRHRLGPDELFERLADIREKLLAERTRRMTLRRDDKVLANWNGLVLSSLARAHQAFGNEHWLDLAHDLADYIRGELLTQDGIRHVNRTGQDDIAGQLSDYAHVAEGFLYLYESDFDVAHLVVARTLTDRMVERFHDSDGGFFTTAEQTPGIISRTRSAFDSPVPSGNSVAASNLLRLARITGDSSYEHIAVGTIRRFYPTVMSYPAGFARLLAALDYRLHAGTELAIFVPDDSTAQKFTDVLRNHPDPYRTTVMVRGEHADSETTAFTPLVGSRSAPRGRAAAFLCRNATCLPPVNTATELERLLGTPGSLDTNSAPDKL